MTHDFRVPAEWAPHSAIWTAWPTTEDLWLHELEAVRTEVAAMIKALATGDQIYVLASTPEIRHSAREYVGLHAEVIEAGYGDIWLRDTGPVFSRNEKDGRVRAEIFGFNGWGGKYVMPPDEQVGATIAKLADCPSIRHNFVLEGGSVDTDGAGTLLTTRQCLLNPNRNKGWDEAKAEDALRFAYGAEKIIWLDEGLINDHTDGHIDNIARFIAPGRVVCQSPNGPNDPNAEILKTIEEKLRAATGADGKKLEVATVPSPGLLATPNGSPVPASHMNFVIGNKAVVVPTYNDRADEALDALAALFPDRSVAGVSARALLTAGGDAPGGGAFHCMTQQQPA